MMNELMYLADSRLCDRMNQIRRQPLMQQVIDANAIERNRFRLAYRMRSLINRYVPRMAPLLGA